MAIPTGLRSLSRALLACPGWMLGRGGSRPPPPCWASRPCRACWRACCPTCCSWPRSRLGRRRPSSPRRWRKCSGSRGAAGCFPFAFALAPADSSPAHMYAHARPPLAALRSWLFADGWGGKGRAERQSRRATTKGRMQNVYRGDALGKWDGRDEGAGGLARLCLGCDAGLIQ